MRRCNPSATEDRIDRIRAIVKNCQWEKIEGYMVDLFSASAIVAVYDALNPTNREMFARMPLPKMQSVAMKLLKK